MTQIEQARLSAISDALTHGVAVKYTQNLQCNLQRVEILDITTNSQVAIETVDYRLHEKLKKSDHFIMRLGRKTMKLIHQPKLDRTEIGEHDEVCKVMFLEEEGEGDDNDVRPVNRYEYCVLKRNLLYNLTRSLTALSNDRLLRVRM